MKSYNKPIFKMHLEELKGGIVKDTTEVLIDSDEFISKFADSIKFMTLYERDKKSGALKARSSKYASLGCMNAADLLQEGYLCFLEAYKNIDWSREDIQNAPEDEKGAIVWSFIKTSMLRRLERRIRELKDGIRVTEWGMFGKTKKKEESGVNFNFFTKNFSQLDKMFGWVGEEESTNSHMIDLIGFFLEVQMDKYLDRTFKGEANPRGIERQVIKRLFGIDTEEENYSDLAKYYGKSNSTIRKVKERALTKLKDDKCKLEIAEFAEKYHMRFGTWFDKQKQEMVTPGVYEWLDDYRKNNIEKK